MSGCMSPNKHRREVVPASLSRSPAIFTADSLGLDFLNSVATPLDREIDWIDSGEGLLAWLGQAELVPGEVLEALRAQAVPGELDSVAAQARSLREWFRDFVHKHRGRPLIAKDLAALGPLNRLLERDDMFGRIVARPAKVPTALELRMLRQWRSPEALLLPIAEALAKFVSEEDFSKVKACEGRPCTLLVLDRTRGRRRRWCSMAICGNRAKQAAHRHRLKAMH
jgi:predicted RNA-binding Zn ribbon-like protein